MYMRGRVATVVKKYMRIEIPLNFEMIGIGMAASGV
jgi:hypothetical protein